MTDAADRIAHFSSLARVGTHVALTWMSVQRATDPAGPGIAAFGFGQRGSGVDTAENGLDFAGVHLYFSDRRAGVAQLFSVTSPDVVNLVLFTTATGAARLSVHNETWDADSNSIGDGRYDPVSRQLLFDIPGAGPRAPVALALIGLTSPDDHG